MAKHIISSVAQYKGDRGKVLWSIEYNKRSTSELNHALIDTFKNARKLAIGGEIMVDIWDENRNALGVVIAISKSTAIYYTHVKKPKREELFLKVKADGTFDLASPSEIAKANAILDSMF